MRLLPSLAAIAVISVNVAHADTIFNVNLTLASGGSVTGTITLNNALTTFEGGELSAVSVPNGASYPGLSLDTSYTSFNPPGVIQHRCKGTMRTTLFLLRPVYCWSFSL